MNAGNKLTEALDKLWLGLLWKQRVRVAGQQRGEEGGGGGGGSEEAALSCISAIFLDNWCGGQRWGTFDQDTHGDEYFYPLPSGMGTPPPNSPS